MSNRIFSVSLAGLNRTLERPVPRAVARALTVGTVVGAVDDIEFGTAAGMVTLGVSLAAHGVARRRERRVQRPGHEEPGAAIG